MPVFRWTKQKEQAAALLADDSQTDEKISEVVGIGRTTLHEWKKAPEFAARVKELVDAHRAVIRSRGLAIIENRVGYLQDRHNRMTRLIEARAASPQMQDVAGGDTGLLVHNVKSIGSGENAERVDLYEVDTGLLKELREHEKQAAQELGQWMEKVDHTSAGQAMHIVLKGVSLDDL